MNVLKINAMAKATASAVGLAATLLATAAYSADQTDSGSASGYYFSGFIGAGFTDDASFAGIVTPPGGAQTVDIDFGTDFNFGGSIGTYLYSLETDSYLPRLELELSHLKSDVDSLDFSGNGSGVENNTDGDISRTLLMANFLVDLKNDSGFTPYLGAGVGLAFTDIDMVYGGPVGAPPPISFVDSDTNVAAQAIVGASIEVAADVSMFVDGRYTQVFDVDADRFNPGGFTGNLEEDVDNLSLNFGIRIDF